ncbi:MAG: type III pantothenate kinase [Bdellovibrionales bacterium]|nr:type III pantothenate kinase [Bdellovibrionales bacterium]
MILALDVGNSQIFGGIIEETPQGPKILFRFRKTSKGGSSSDEYGLFLRQVLRENGFDAEKITRIAIATVVPDVMHSLKGACQKYFDETPFVLQAGVKTGLKVRYKNPVEVGADRIANSIGAVARYPGKNLVIIDLGTATTFCAVTKDKDYLGGSILAGLKISMEALESKTAKLPSVEIVAPENALGKTTIESIQMGLYYGHLGSMREIVARIAKEAFDGEKPFVIGTGGFSRLFERDRIFDVEIPDLVLFGLYEALKMNPDA